MSEDTNARHDGDTGRKAPFTERDIKLVQESAGRMTDMSWLAEFDLGTIEALESFSGAMVYRHGGADRYCSLGDQLACAAGCGRAVALVFDAYRRHLPAEDGMMDDYILPILLVAQEAYEIGVRDAVRGVVSEESQGKIADARDRMDGKFEELIEFHHDIDGLGQDVE